MKKINYITALFVSLSLVFTSCDDTGETTTIDQGVQNGGVVTTLAGTSGKLLGTPQDPFDLENSEVTLTDSNAELTLTVSTEPGHIAANVASYEVVKSFKGGAEVSVAESATLPFSVQMNTIAELFDGLNVDQTTLRIGDKINFKVKVKLNDGSVFYQASNASKYSVTVNCLSDLAGDYAWGTYQPLLQLEEKSPGVYRMPYLGRFSGIYWIEFEDVCGSLTITDWQFAASNPITQNEPGYVDTNGDIVFPSLDVAGVSWYVGLSVRYTKL